MNLSNQFLHETKKNFKFIFHYKQSKKLTLKIAFPNVKKNIYKSSIFKFPL